MSNLEKAVIATAVNWKNRTLFIGDNLDVMRAMNSGTIDLIYLDPPFNSKRLYQSLSGTSFKDFWTFDDLREVEFGLLAHQNQKAYDVARAAGQVHGKGMQAYLTMMATRLIECRRLLKETGSIYLHCDPSANAYLRLLMDAIFGKDNFRNEIVWHYNRWTIKSKKSFPKLHDTILFYAKSKKTKINPILVPNLTPNPSQYVSAKDEDGKTVVKKDASGKPIKRTPSSHLVVGSTWDIPIISPNSKERVGQKTQKPQALLERIIKASSNSGDIVLDPFCGCATTLVQSDIMSRHWVGIDIDRMAIKKINQRMTGAGKPGMPVGSKPIIREVDKHGYPSRSDRGKPIDNKDAKQILYGVQEGNCNLCGLHLPYALFEVDHIWPKSKGLDESIGNKQLLCSHCNRVKGNGTMEEASAKLRKAGIAVVKPKRYANRKNSVS